MENNLKGDRYVDSHYNINKEISYENDKYYENGPFLGRVSFSPRRTKSTFNFSKIIEQAKLQ